MTLDRYTKAILTAIALALWAIALTPWLARDGWLAALGPDAAEAQRRRRETAIPADWGKVVGYSDGYGLFEAPDGTLRQIGLGNGAVTGITRRK